MFGLDMEGLEDFSKVMLNSILHVFQQHGITAEESGSWRSLPAIQTFQQLKHWLMGPGSWAQDCSAARSMSDYDGTKIHQLVSTVPRCLWTVVKEEGMLNSGKQDPLPTFLRHVAAIKFKNNLYYFLIMVHFLCLNICCFLCSVVIYEIHLYL